MIANHLKKKIDAEIAKLQGARTLLASIGARRTRGPGRPTKSFTGIQKRILSEEARARIAAAQKKRWASAKKAAVKNSRAKNVSEKKTAKVVTAKKAAPAVSVRPS